ncbi:MAG: tetratricopeptide repeat protein [Candidatus Eisenbacteria bacterium]|nr:tetratricopeptide repeat protein [Candidatus Latescibacterota bacterium]MBD3301865.1 tetratricopeptide repeat protein [Candidatus Eisenbacteria bacterium]
MTEGRMTKEELREDKVVTAITDAGQWAKKNAVALTIGIVLVIAAVVVVQVVRQGRARAEREAAVLLLEGESLYQSGGATEALPRFSEAAEQYSGSRSGRIARLRVADCRLELGQHEQAIEGYARFLETGAAEGMLRASALRGQASAHDSMDEHARAAELFLQAADVPQNPFAGDDLISAGNAWLDAGNRENAMAAFGRFLAEHPAHPRTREAEEGLAWAEAMKAS